MRRSAFVLLALLVAGCDRKTIPPPPVPYKAPPVGPAVGNTAPVLELIDSRGVKFRSTGLIGTKAQLLVFGTTMCERCKANVAEVEAVRLAQPAEVEVTAVLMSETAERAHGYAAETGAGFRMLLDPQNCGITDWKVGNFPHFVLIDKQGIIRYTGPELPSRETISQAAR